MSNARSLYTVKENQKETGVVFKVATYTIPVEGSAELTNFTTNTFNLSGCEFLSRPSFTYGVQCCDTAGVFNGNNAMPTVTAAIKDYPTPFTNARVMYTIKNVTGAYKFDLNLTFMGYGYP